MRFTDDEKIVISPDNGTTIVTIEKNKVTMAIGDMKIVLSPDRIDLGAENAPNAVMADALVRRQRSTRSFEYARRIARVTPGMVFAGTRAAEGLARNNIRRLRWPLHGRLNRPAAGVVYLLRQANPPPVV